VRGLGSWRVFDGLFRREAERGDEDDQRSGDEELGGELLTRPLHVIGQRMRTTKSVISGAAGA
jgi:hypothetical protein